MKWVFTLACVLTLSVSAATTDEIIGLAQKNVGEDVLLATVEASKASFNLSAADILKLKEAKVSDKVITAMIKHKGNGVAARPVEPAPEPAPVREVPAEQPIAPPPIATADGTLNIENVDDRAWAYTYEPDVKTIWITAANGDRGKLEAHGGISLRMKAGSYKVRYNGEDRGQSVTVHAGEKSLLLLSRVETKELEALYVSVFEKGERKSGGRLVVLRDKPAARETLRKVDDLEEVGEAPERVEEKVTERVIERERVVEVPSTTVIYRDPYPTYYSSVYVGPSYCGPRYYSGYCGPRYYSSYCGPRYYSPYRSGYTSFGYSRYGRRSGFSVGVGFGF
ncbi:MAG TPA: hypothetical protein VEJ63_10170 [Planctomycetota bacterium]|nr:hypothetical protein [Planctomycetota bacterium]